MKILILNGPNINLLGKREPNIYGNITYNDLVKIISDYCNNKQITVEFYQTNHEGAIIDKLQESDGVFDYILINAGGYAHTSIAVRDCIAGINTKCLEIHLTDIKQREDFRHFSYLTDVCCNTFMGKGINSYIEAIDYLFTLDK